MLHELDIPLVSADHSSHIYARLAEDGYWNVSAVIHGHEILHERYARWQQVEHLRDRLQIALLNGEAAAISRASRLRTVWLSPRPPR